MDFPDFHIPHSEKIEWMIETNGWAFEAAGPVADVDPPVPSYGYSIGLPALANYPDIAIFGLTPSAANGMLTMLVGLLLGGTELPVGPELVGVLDNGLRCRFVPLEADAIVAWMPTAVAWYRGDLRPAVQLLYPDRAGSLPYEPSFDRRLRFAQPIVGDLIDEWE